MRFPFSISDVQVECAHCGHQLGEKGPAEASFGLDIVRCGFCAKFTQLRSSVETVKVRTPVKAEG